MERTGLIRRVRDETDRRKVRLFLTDAGRALYADLIGPASDIPRAALAGLTQRDIETLIEHLTHIQRNLDACYNRLTHDSQPYAAPPPSPAGRRG